MSTPFLTAFAKHVVRTLVEREQLALRRGASVETVANEVAATLADPKEFAQLVPSLSRALIDAEGVDELFADDEELRDAVDAVPPEALPKGPIRGLTDRSE